MTHWAASSRRSELARALHKAARKPLGDVFRRRDQADQADFKILTEAAKELECDKWTKAEYNDALRDVVRRATEEEVFQRATRGMSKPDRPEKSTMSWREIAATLCGLENAKEASAIVVGNNHIYTQRYQFIKQRTSFVSDSTFKKDVIEPCWPLLADALASLKPSSRESGRALIPANRHYISRPLVEAEFSAALEAGAKIIVFVGQPGMGKTWLAQELTKAPDGSRAPRIRFYNGVPHVYDVQHALAVSNVDKLVANEPGTQLVALCSGKDAPPFILIDNLDSSDELYSIFPEPVSSTIVATCRVRGQARPAEYKFIDVSRMTLSEATTLVSSYRPDLSDADAGRLARVLSGYPLAIEKSCAAIGRSKMSVEQFCRDFKATSGRVIGQFVTEDHNRLMAILMRLLEQLDTRETLALDVLSFSVLSQLYTLGPTPERAIWYFLRANYDSAVTRLELAQTLDIVEDFALIEFERNELTGERMVSSHPLVWSMIYESMPECQAGYAVALRRSLELLLTEELDPLDADVLTLMFVGYCGALGNLVVRRWPSEAALNELTGGSDQSFKAWESHLVHSVELLMIIARAANVAGVYEVLLDRVCPGIMNHSRLYRDRAVCPIEVGENDPSHSSKSGLAGRL